MNNREVQILAAEFVLGTLNRATLLRFKDELTHNPALRDAVKDWERRLGGQTSGARHSALTELSQQISQRLRSQDKAAAIAKAEPEAAWTGDVAESDAAPRLYESEPGPERSPVTRLRTSARPADPGTATERGATLVRADEGDWEALAPRVYKKPLAQDAGGNRQSYLLRLIPGGRVEIPQRGGIEEIYVIEGRIEVDGGDLRAGDFQAFSDDSFVADIVARGDSLLLVRGRAAGAMPDPEGTA